MLELCLNYDILMDQFKIACYGPAYSGYASGCTVYDYLRYFIILRLE